MTKSLLILIALVLTIACQNNNLKDRPNNQTITVDKAKDTLSLDNIRFDFSSNYKKDKKGLVKINATILNNNVDTVYFLSWSCNGLISQLKYDTTALGVFPDYLCNMSYPLIEKVSPKGQLKFNASFLLKKDVSKVKIGFGFYRVEPTFDLTSENVAKLYKQRKETILWADEKTLQ